ncbi:hypothetical protein ACJ5NV_16610 [Loktanella agnita]
MVDVRSHVMKSLATGYRGFLVLVCLNMDWLRFAVILLIALYSGAYLMMS